MYETLSRKEMTVGGYSISDEMCINYMHYYPAVDLELCKSSIADTVLAEFFDKMRYFDRSNTSSSRKTVIENFNSIRWTPLTSSMLSRLYDTSLIAFSCNRSDGTNFESVYNSNDVRRQGGWFKPIRAKNLTTRYAMIDPRLRETCEKTIDYGFDDEEDDDDHDEHLDFNAQNENF